MRSGLHHVEGVTLLMLLGGSLVLVNLVEINDSLVLRSILLLDHA